MAHWGIEQLDVEATKARGRKSYKLIRHNGVPLTFPSRYAAEGMCIGRYLPVRIVQMHGNIAGKRVEVAFTKGG